MLRSDIKTTLKKVKTLDHLKSFVNQEKNLNFHAQNNIDTRWLILLEIVKLKL
jgi:hypothetical protein